MEDHSALLTICLASKACAAAATPRAFRILTVRDGVESARALIGLQNCSEEITGAVHEVVFKGDPEGVGGDVYVAEDQTSGAEGRDALSAAFSGLPKFPNLAVLRFDFHAYFQEQEGGTEDVPDERPSHFLHLQRVLLAALAANRPPSLVSMALHNIIAIPNDLYGDDDAKRFLRCLTRLRLFALRDTTEKVLCSNESFRDFWEQMLEDVMHEAESLTTLELDSDPPVEFCFVLGEVHLPCLTTLMLCNFLFNPAEPDADVEAFVARHGATLTHLELDRCNVYGRAEPLSFERPWHLVLRRFEEDLPLLSSFTLTDFGYTTLAFGQYRVNAPVGTEAKDVAALQRLLAIAEVRQSAGL